MSNIIKVANEKDKILKFDHVVFCPKCNEKQFAGFDKLFTEVYGICIDCADEKFIEENSTNIFRILEV